jgi:hypothetical protein
MVDVAPAKEHLEIARHVDNSKRKHHTARGGHYGFLANRR